MKLKEFFKSIDHRFRDAVPIDGEVVSATLINWSDDPVGTAVYNIDTQQVLKIAVTIGNDTHEWNGTGDTSEIMSLLLGQIESTTQHLDQLDLDRVVEQFTTAPAPTVSSAAEQTGYTVNITATFTMVVDSATMDSALAEAKGRLKLPNSVQYKINKELVEKYY